MIKNIIDNSNKSIIVIQADHGIPPYACIKSKRKERFQIFNAFYFYNRDYSLLTENISLVNSWRVIFNSHFNQKFDLLENKMYWSLFYLPYDLYEMN